MHWAGMSEPHCIGTFATSRALRAFILPALDLFHFQIDQRCQKTEETSDTAILCGLNRRSDTRQSRL